MVNSAMRDRARAAQPFIREDVPRQAGSRLSSQTLGRKLKRRTILAALIVAAGVGCGIFANVESPMQLQVTDERISKLVALRAEPKFLDLPGAPAAEERRRLEPLFNSLLDRLISGVKANPTDTWVLGQMDSTVEAFHLEDTEARERCLVYIDRVFKILGMPNDRGAFRKYLIFW